MHVLVAIDQDVFNLDIVQQVIDNGSIPDQIVYAMKSVTKANISDYVTE